VHLTLLSVVARPRLRRDAAWFLISPFVGRIYDWYIAARRAQDFRGHDDPGVQSVARIYRYYKSASYATAVMGSASAISPDRSYRLRPD